MISVENTVSVMNQNDTSMPAVSLRMSCTSDVHSAPYDVERQSRYELSHSWS